MVGEGEVEGPFMMNRVPVRIVVVGGKSPISISGDFTNSQAPGLSGLPRAVTPDELGLGTFHRRWNTTGRSAPERLWPPFPEKSGQPPLNGGRPPAPVSCVPRRLFWQRASTALVGMAVGVVAPEAR